MRSLERPHVRDYLSECGLVESQPFFGYPACFPQQPPPLRGSKPPFGIYAFRSLRVFLSFLVMHEPSLVDAACYGLPVDVHMLAKN